MNKTKSFVIHMITMIILCMTLVGISSIKADAIDYGSNSVNKTLAECLGDTNTTLADIEHYIKSHTKSAHNYPTGDDKLFAQPYKGLGSSNKNYPWRLVDWDASDYQGMNCTGLVAHVMWKTGSNMGKMTYRMNGWYANACNWNDLAAGYKDGYNPYNTGCQTYRYTTIQEMLNANRLTRGDIIYFEPRYWAAGDDCHIGFYWGPGNWWFHTKSGYPEFRTIVGKIAENRCWLYAIKAAPAKITYDKNTTDSVSNMPTYGKKYIGYLYTVANNIPTREGYEFLGWSENANAASASLYPGQSWACSDENHTLYAVWAETSYKITYDANGGLNAPTTGIKQKDVNFTISQIQPTKSGYKFLGWSEDKDATTATYQPKDILKENRNYTLYAIWGLGDSTLTIDMNGGTLLDNYANSYTVTTKNSVLIDTTKISKDGKEGYANYNLIPSGYGTFGGYGYNTNWKNTLDNGLILSGTSLFADGYFKDGLNDVGSLDSNSTLSRVRKSDNESISNNCDTPSDWMIKITSSVNANGTWPTAYTAGFNHTSMGSINSENNHYMNSYYHLIYAKVPKGMSLNALVSRTSAYIGDNVKSKVTWITDNRGTGDWKWYEFKVDADTDGLSVDYPNGVYLTVDDGVDAGTVISGTVEKKTISDSDASKIDSTIEWYVGYSNIFNASSTGGTLKTFGYYNTTNVGATNSDVKASEVMTTSEISEAHNVSTVKRIDTEKGKTYTFGLGGFFTNMRLWTGHTYYYTLYAKIPSGYQVQFTSPSLSTNKIHWITDNKGTGKWRWYQFSIEEKDYVTGVYGYLGHANGLYLTKSSSYVAANTNVNTSFTSLQNTYTTATENVSWYVATYERTDLNDIQSMGYDLVLDKSKGIYVINTDISDYIKWQSDGDALLYASYEPNTYTVNYNTNGGVNEIGERTYTYNNTYQTPTVTNKDSLIDLSDTFDCQVTRTLLSDGSMTIKAEDSGIGGIGINSSDIPRLSSDGDVQMYKLSFKLTTNNGTINAIGGHAFWYNIDHVIIDGKYYTKGEKIWANDYDHLDTRYILDQNIKTHTIDVYFTKKEKNSAENDAFYIQCNRGTTSSWTATISDFSLTTVDSNDEINLTKKGYKFVGWDLENKTYTNATQSLEDGSYVISPTSDSSSAIDTLYNNFYINTMRDNSFSQIFNIKYVKNGYYQIVNESTNCSLRVSLLDGMVEQGYLDNKNTKTTDLWKLVDNGNGSYLLESKQTLTNNDTTHHKYYIQVSGQGLVVTKNKNEATSFTFKKSTIQTLKDDTYQFSVANDPSMVLGVQNNNVESGGNIIVTKDKKNETSKFRVINYNNGFAGLANAASASYVQNLQIHTGDETLDGNFDNANVTQYYYYYPDYYNYDTGGYQWKFINTGNDEYLIVAQFQGNIYYLQVGEVIDSNSKNVRVTMDSSKATKFNINKTETVESGLYYINAHTNNKFGFDIYNNTGSELYEDGTIVELYQQNNAKNQLFEITKLSNGLYTIKNYSSQKYIRTTALKDGTSITQGPLNDYSYWQFVSDSDGGIRIMNASLYYYMSVAKVESLQTLTVNQKSDSLYQLFDLQKSGNISISKTDTVGKYLINNIDMDLSMIDNQDVKIVLADNKNYALTADKTTSTGNVSIQKVKTFDEDTQRFKLDFYYNTYSKVELASNNALRLNIYNPNNSIKDGQNVQIFGTTTGGTPDSGELWDAIKVDTNKYIFKSENGYYLTYTGDLEDGTANLCITTNKSKAKEFSFIASKYTYDILQVGNELLNNTSLVNKNNQSVGQSSFIWYPDKTGDYKLTGTIENAGTTTIKSSQDTTYTVDEIEQQPTTDFMNGDSFYNLSSVNNDTLTMNAVWQPIKYTLRLHSNYGEDEIAFQTVEYDQTFTIDNTLTRPGYKLIGWSKVPYGYTKDDISFTLDGEYKNLVETENGHYDLYAVWEELSYNIVYHSNTTPDKTIVEPDKFKAGVTYTYRPATTFLKTGYKIVGWGLTPDATEYALPGSEFKDLATEDNETIHLYAIWKPISYTIKFNANDSDKTPSATGKMNSLNLNYDQINTLPTNKFVRKGMTFLGWTTNPKSTTVMWEDGNSISNLTTIDGSTITLYAVWRYNTYTINYHWQNGDPEDVETITCTCYKYYTTPNLIEYPGHEFLTWMTMPDGDITVDDETTFTNFSYIDGDVIDLYADWRLISYTVKFDANDNNKEPLATGTMSEQRFQYEQFKSLSKCTYKRTDMIFMGWSKDKTSNHVDYKDGELVGNLLTKRGTITLYAVWVKLPGVTVDDIYIFENEKDKVDENFIKTESHLKEKPNKDNITVKNYSVSNMDEIKKDLDKGKSEIDIKFDVIYSVGDEYTTTTTCKLHVVEIVHADDGTARIRYIADPTYISESSIWTKTVENQILRTALGVKPEDVSDSYEITK